jgi:hypothetical protein
MSETTFNQINNLTEEMQLRFYVAVCNYGINDIEPNFTGIEKSLWIPMKDLIDYSNERSKTNSDNGSKGGAPAGNNNRNQAKSSEINRQQPNIADVMQEAKKNGFYIDQGKANEFFDCGLDPLWLTGPHSFLEFTAERIHGNYRDKPQGEQKALFISAVMTWDELRDEYPDWKAKKEKNDREAANKTAEKKAWENHPVKCWCCGADLRTFHDDYFCDSCKTSYEFNKEKLEWEIREQDGIALSATFNEHMKLKNPGKEIGL